MQTEIEYGPAYAIAKGGVMKGLRRAVLGGESLFMNTFTAPAEGGDILFAPKLPGDVMVLPLDGGTIYLQSGAYLASEQSIDIDTHWGGAKTFFSRQGLFILKASGRGQIVVGSFGAIHAVDLEPGQTYTVGTGHLVGWTEGVGYQVKKVGGWKSTLLSGEGLVCDLTGPGVSTSRPAARTRCCAGSRSACPRTTTTEPRPAGGEVRARR